MTNDDIKSIADHYGLSHQTAKLIEELAELIQALAKDEFAESDKGMEHVVEEIADVEIMLEQIKYLLCIHEAALNSIKTYKIMRTLAGIGGNREWKD